MTPPPGTPRQVIVAALEDWWLDTDPSAPFDAEDVARNVEVYLVSSGYRIAPYPRTPIPGPTRLHVALAALLALACTAGALYTLTREHWAWTLPLAFGAALSGWAAADAHHDRRTHHQDPT